MIEMTDMAKIEAERKALPLSVLKRKCREMRGTAAPADGFVCSAPVLDEYMIYAARASGESTVVLDVSLADRGRLVFFSKLASFLGMSCVFQVRTFNQVLAAVSMGASAVQIPACETASILAGTVPADVRCFIGGHGEIPVRAAEMEAVPAS